MCWRFFHCVAEVETLCVYLQTRLMCSLSLSHKHTHTPRPALFLSSLLTFCDSRMFDEVGDETFLHTWCGFLQVTCLWRGGGHVECICTCSEKLWCTKLDWLLVRLNLTVKNYPWNIQIVGTFSSRWRHTVLGAGDALIGRLYDYHQSALLLLPVCLHRFL